MWHLGLGIHMKYGLLCVQNTLGTVPQSPRALNFEDQREREGIQLIVPDAVASPKGCNCIWKG